MEEPGAALGAVAAIAEALGAAAELGVEPAVVAATAELVAESDAAVAIAEAPAFAAEPDAAPRVAAAIVEVLDVAAEPDVGAVELADAGAEPGAAVAAGAGRHRGCHLHCPHLRRFRARGPDRMHCLPQEKGSGQ